MSFPVPRMTPHWLAHRAPTKRCPPGVLQSGVLVLAVLGWLGGKPAFRLFENSFWSLQALGIQPAYAICREGLRHLLEGLLPSGIATAKRNTTRAAGAAMSGLLIGAAAFGLAAAAWPASRWVGSLADLASPHLLVPIAFANAVVIIGIYNGLVMGPWSHGAWGRADGSADVTMLGDGNGDLAQALGLTMDGSGFGLGQRFDETVVDGGDLHGPKLTRRVVVAHGRFSLGPGRRLGVLDRPDGFLGIGCKLHGLKYLPQRAGPDPADSLGHDSYGRDVGDQMLSTGKFRASTSAAALART